MSQEALSVKELSALISQAGQDELVRLEQLYADDERIGVRRAFERAHAALLAQKAESARVESLYVNERELCQGCLCMGLDEVGRGPLAGPLAVAAVVLDDAYRIAGLNDSKQVPESKRATIAADIKRHARAWTVELVEPHDIDTYGMAACLRRAFTLAIEHIDSVLPGVECVLLDGNPLRIDEREVNIVKGDATCASIAAASIVAKVERDELMRAYGAAYPAYGFASNKGYGSADHIQAIKEQGLCPIHRTSFCSSFMQEALF